jgi:hypothetical protein
MVRTEREIHTEELNNSETKLPYKVYSQVSMLKSFTQDAAINLVARSNTHR